MKKIGSITVDPYPKTASELHKDILSAVNDFVINDFGSKHFLQYLYEADIQAHLACKLDESFSDRIVFCESDKKDVKYELTPVTREYPVGVRHDIVLINPFMLEKYVSRHLEQSKSGTVQINHVLWELPLLAGIEIKYSLFGYTVGLDHSIADFKKLKKYKDSYHQKRNKNFGGENFTEQFKHLSLLFFQDKEWFDIHVKSHQPRLSKVERIDAFNSIYLISHKGNLYKYDASND